MDAGSDFYKKWIMEEETAFIPSLQSSLPKTVYAIDSGQKIHKEAKWNASLLTRIKFPQANWSPPHCFSRLHTCFRFLSNVLLWELKNTEHFFFPRTLYPVPVCPMLHFILVTCLLRSKLLYFYSLSSVLPMLPYCELYGKLIFSYTHLPIAAPSLVGCQGLIPEIRTVSAKNGYLL